MVSADLATRDHGHRGGPSEIGRVAHDLAEFIIDVHGIGTRDRTFSGHGRGGDLRSHDEWMETCFRNSEQLLDVPRLRRL